MARGPTLALALLAGLPPTACVEIDPSYGESHTSTTAPTTDPGSTDPSATSTPSTDDGSTTAPPACDCQPHEVCQAGTCAAPSKILFVNLDGVTATFGAADASQDSHNLYEELAGTWSGYGADEPTRQALLSTLAAQWAPFAVFVTAERPPAGSPPYLQAVVTADPPPAGFEGVAWIAFPDCGDAIPRDMVFVFASSSGGDTALLADYVSGALARALGLQFTDAPDDITGFGSQFVETCYPRAESPACAAHHPEFCGGDANQQSSRLELEALLGARDG